MADHDAELDAIAAELEAAGLLAIEARADGGVRYRLTQEGAQVAGQMALSSEADGDGMLDALLEGCGPSGP